MLDHFRALIIDDDRDLLKLIQRTLEFTAGWEVHTAPSGASGLELARRLGPNVILVDVVMPEIDGYEVCRRLRADPATQMLPVVMITASGDREKVKAIEEGADDFIAKPFNQEELLARVRSLLRIKAYHDTIRAQAAEL